MYFIISFTIILFVCRHSVVTTSRKCTSGYCEYHVGDPQSKIVLAAPHGGSLRPSSIPDREQGCFIAGSCQYIHPCETEDDTECKVKSFRDTYTKELSELLRKELKSLTGFFPHLIVNNLHRIKMDANRDDTNNEATFGHPEAKLAYNEFHSFIKTAKESITGNGLFIDMHGQRHAHGKQELGYLVTKYRLNENKTKAVYSSLRGLSNRVSDDFDVILRGAKSLGYFLQIRGYKVIPSPDNYSPGDDSYFTGGYNTRKYGSRYGGTVDSVQIESHANVRNKVEGPTYARTLAEAVKAFMDANSY